MNETLGDIGESELINRISKFMRQDYTSDDTAEIANSANNLLINTDVLVEGVHYSSRTSSPEDTGWKAITANVSDLASSGAEQMLGFTVGLVAPPQTTWEWVEGVYIGIEKALQKFGGELLGGDCSKGNQTLLAVTALGRCGPLRLHRGNAMPGDFLVSSGPHGLSRLGLALLMSDHINETNKINRDLKKKAILAHQRPEPPVEALQILKDCKPNNIPWRAAGTDSSDGLYQALQNICLSSNCMAIVEDENLPRPQKWPKGNPWDNWCINGGEDFELILSLPPLWAKVFIQAFPQARKIGKIESGPPKVIWEDGSEIKQTICLDYKHF